MGNFAYISIIALFCYSFLLFAFMAAKKNKLIYSFILVLISTILWTGGSFCMRMQLWPSIKFWYDISIYGLLLLAFSFINFLYAFANAKARFFRALWFIVLMSIGTVNAFTGFFLKRPDIVLSSDGTETFVYHTTYSVSYLFIICAFLVGHMFYLLYKIRKEDKIKRKQFTPIMVGVIIIFIGHLGIMIPALSGFPIDIVSGVLNVFCMAYALYKRRLFKLNLLISKGNCYAISALVSIFVFSNLIDEIEEFINGNFAVKGTNYTLLVAITFTFFTVILYYIMKKLFDKIFIKEEVIRASTLKEFSSSVSTSLHINEILEKMVNVIQNTISVKKVYVCIANDDGTGYTIAHSTSPLDKKDFFISINNPIVTYLKNNNECILMEDFKRLVDYKSMWETEKNQLFQLNIECFVPLKENDTLIGIILLSGKYRYAKFTYDDMEFLSSINSIGSIAVKNSRLYEKAYYEARTDDLTGLYKRKYFFEILNDEFNKNKSSSLALVILNIDDFKLYNQLYGNKEGDVALQNVARIIKLNVGKSGYVARYSGKEFAIILPGYDIQTAKNLAENIRKQIHDLNKRTSEYTLKALTVSGGVSAIPYAASTVKQLVENADMAVFQVKRNGKNAILVCNTTFSTTQNNKDVNMCEHREGIYSEYASTIYALTAAINTKDHYTFNHSKNVAYYATELAYAYGMNDEAVEIVREAALLHDIGKIGISEQILNKPGKLEDHEYEIMKGHVENSVGIIRHLPSLDYVIPAVIGHHERYDGYGYPRRIAGEDIPLSARILCIADSFDAMISSRSYKKPYPLEYALSELKAQQGRQFDPKLADIFIQLVNNKKIKPILDDNEDTDFFMSDDIELIKS